MEYTSSHGAVIRGPRDRKRLSLIFTGGHFGEGFEHVLNVLKSEGIHASFYFTGDFFAIDSHHELIHRAIAEGHVVGPHSHGHPLYCAWEDRNKTLINRDEFLSDLNQNISDLRAFGVPDTHLHWWIPPYEWYNEEVAHWAHEAGHPLFNFTPGTLSHTDYTEDDAKNYRPNQVIWDSIINFERDQPDGLNGFILLIHVGAGPRRTQKFFLQLGPLIHHLRQRGYTFATIPEMLESAD